MSDIIKLRFTHPGNEKKGGVVVQFFTLRAAQAEVRMWLGPNLVHNQVAGYMTNDRDFGKVWLVDGGGMITSLEDLRMVEG